MTMIAGFVSGNIGRDAKLGTSGDVVNFSVASRRWDYKKKEEVTDWVSCALWGPRAEKLVTMLTSGTRVAVRGTIQARIYHHNNEWKSEIVVRADDVDLLGSSEKRDVPRMSAPSQNDHHADEIPF